MVTWPTDEQARLDERGDRRLAWGDRKVTVTCTSTLYNCTELKSISEWSTHQTFREMDYIKDKNTPGPTLISHKQEAEAGTGWLKLENWTINKKTRWHFSCLQVPRLCKPVPAVVKLNGSSAVLYILRCFSICQGCLTVVVSQKPRRV